MKPSFVKERSVWKDTNRELVLETTTPGNVCPQNLPSSGAELFTPSYTVTLSIQQFLPSSTLNLKNSNFTICKRTHTNVSDSNILVRQMKGIGSKRNTRHNENMAHAQNKTKPSEHTVFKYAPFHTILCEKIRVNLCMRICLFCMQCSFNICFARQCIFGKRKN